MGGDETCMTLDWKISDNRLFVSYSWYNLLFVHFAIVCGSFCGAGLKAYTFQTPGRAGTLAP